MFRQPKFFGRFDKVAVVVEKDANWTPLAREQQIGVAIAVDVAEDRAVHETDVCERAAPRLVRLKPALVIAENSRRCRFGITAWQDASAHEQIQLTIAINVAKCQRAAAGFKRREARAQ